MVDAEDHELLSSTDYMLRFRSDSDLTRLPNLSESDVDEQLPQAINSQNVTVSELAEMDYTHYQPGRRYGGCLGVLHPPGLRGCRQFLEFCVLSANLETFCFRKYFVGNISRPIRKSTSLPQQRDIEQPLDTNKDGRM